MGSPTKFEKMLEIFSGSDKERAGASWQGLHNDLHASWRYLLGYPTMRDLAGKTPNTEPAVGAESVKIWTVSAHVQCT